MSKLILFFSVTIGLAMAFSMAYFVFYTTAVLIDIMQSSR